MFFVRRLRPSFHLWFVTIVATSLGGYKESPLAACSYSFLYLVLCQLFGPTVSLAVSFADANRLAVIYADANRLAVFHADANRLSVVHSDANRIAHTESNKVAEWDIDVDAVHY